MLMIVICFLELANAQLLSRTVTYIKDQACIYLGAGHQVFDRCVFPFGWIPIGLTVLAQLRALTRSTRYTVIEARDAMRNQLARIRRRRPCSDFDRMPGDLCMCSFHRFVHVFLGSAFRSPLIHENTDVVA